MTDKVQSLTCNRYRLPQDAVDFKLLHTCFMIITATDLNYFIVCKRKLWLFNNGIQMEQTSEVVADGKLLHETSYEQRNDKHSEILLSATFESIDLFGKIDFYDALNKVIHETKRSNKVEEAHQWQIKFYLWLLKLNGIENATAILEYPLLRQRDQVELNESDIIKLKRLITSACTLKESDVCPPVINAKICKSCSYYELCYVGEE